MTTLARRSTILTIIREQSNRRLWIGMAVTLLFLLILLLPLRLAIMVTGLPQKQFSAFHVSGSIWSGHMLQARFGPLVLGDLDTGLRILPLFVGRTELKLEREPLAGDGGLQATVGKWGVTSMLSHVTASLPAGSVLPALPITRIDLADFSVGFTGERCTNASGMVRVTLDANFPGLPNAPVLSGQARCDDGALLLPLKSAGGTEELTVTMEGDGDYLARLQLTGANESWPQILPAIGFTAVPGGYVLAIEGSYAD